MHLLSNVIFGGAVTFGCSFHYIVYTVCCDDNVTYASEIEKKIVGDNPIEKCIYLVLNFKGTTSHKKQCVHCFVSPFPGLLFTLKSVS